MPLRAISDSGDIHAYQLSDLDWAGLKSSYRSMGIRMPCCGSAAIPKTSSLGNNFFAHYRKGECTSAPESAEHLYCKQIIARAALNAGWDVTTEWMGKSPTGEEWIADVFCQLGDAKRALEIQLSPQSLDETIRRQTRYFDSGVRGAWFFGPQKRPYKLEDNQEVPAFVLSEFKAGIEPIVEGFGVPLSDFVTGMLTKKLVWHRPKINKPIYIEFMEDICWACKRPVKQVYGHFDYLEPDGTQAEEWHPRAFTVAFLSKALEDILSVASNDELAAAGLNLITKRDVVRGKPTSWPFCNQCPHCRAPQDNYHVGEKIRKMLITVTTRTG